MAHRLLVLGCETMRDGVVILAIFFAAAMLLFLAARVLSPTSARWSTACRQVPERRLLPARHARLRTSPRHGDR